MTLKQFFFESALGNSKDFFGVIIRNFLTLNSKISHEAFEPFPSFERFASKYVMRHKLTACVVQLINQIILSPDLFNIM